MKGRNTELRIGVLILVAIVASAAWLLFLKEFKFRTSTYPVTVTFSRVAGLKSGAPVSIRGVDKGKVTAVVLGQDMVRVELEIEEDTFISRDAQFYLATDIVNPTGMRIEQGVLQVALQPCQVVAGTEIAPFTEMLGEGGDLLSTLARLTRRFDVLTSGDRMDKILADLEGGADELHGWAKENRPQTKQLIAKIDKLTDTLSAMMEENRVPLREMLENSSAAMAGVDSLLPELQVLTVSLSSLLEGVQAGEGSLGKLVESDELYDNSVATVARLDSLITEIMDNPKKYISFSIF